MHDNNIEMYSTRNKGKSVIAERFIRILKIYKHMTAVSKNVYIDELGEIVDKYNKTYHRTIKIKPADNQACTILNMVLRIATKILNSDHVILKYKKISLGIHSKLVYEVFAIKQGCFN